MIQHLIFWLILFSGKDTIRMKSTGVFFLESMFSRHPIKWWRIFSYQWTKTQERCQIYLCPNQLLSSINNECNCLTHKKLVYDSAKLIYIIKRIVLSFGALYNRESMLILTLSWQLALWRNLSSNVFSFALP